MPNLDTITDGIVQIYDTGNRTASSYLGKNYPKVIDALFVRKRYESPYNWTEVIDGEGLKDLANRLNSDVELLKALNIEKLRTWGNGTQGFLKDEIIIYQDTTGKQNIRFDPIEGSNLGSEVYLMVKTLNLENSKIVVNIKQGKDNFLLNEHEIMPVLQDGNEVTDIILTVGDLCNDPNIANADEYINDAIGKVQLRPKSDETFKEWKEKFEEDITRQTTMYLYTDGAKENPDIIDRSVIYYGGEGQEGGEVTDGGYTPFGFYAKPEKRVFLDLEPRWFKLGLGNFCLKLGDINKLIQEINIRLMGFGGNLPSEEFTDRTLKMIKQFQKHYMKIEPTGHICGDTLKSIDEFGNKYDVNFNKLKCPCGDCSGFGKGKNPSHRQNPKVTERKRAYEYPGIHRSMYWSIKAVQFWLSEVDKDLKYSLNSISSGYRCWYNNDHAKPNPRKSTNHMGKAIDLHFNKNGKRTKQVADLDEIRLKIFSNRMGAPSKGCGFTKGFGWKKNLIGMEPSHWNKKPIWYLKKAHSNVKGLKKVLKRKKSIPKGHEDKYTKSTYFPTAATTWVHYDIREFDLKYLNDEFFAKTEGDFKGKPIVEVAEELGFVDIVECKCSCPKDESGGAINTN